MNCFHVQECLIILNIKAEYEKTIEEFMKSKSITKYVWVDKILEKYFVIFLPASHFYNPIIFPEVL